MINEINEINSGAFIFKAPEFPLKAKKESSFLSLKEMQKEYLKNNNYKKIKYFLNEKGEIFYKVIEYY